MKVFISQPMRGYTENEIIEERAKAISYIRERYTDVEIIDSILDIGNKTPLECLGESIKLLSQADLVYFLLGWRNARGCRIEHICAEEYGKEILEQQDYISKIINDKAGFFQR